MPPASYKPNIEFDINKITVKNEIRDVIIKFFEWLDDDEDIQNFYTNVDLNI